MAKPKSPKRAAAKPHTVKEAKLPRATAGFGNTEFQPITGLPNQIMKIDWSPAGKIVSRTPISSQVAAQLLADAHHPFCVKNPDGTYAYYVWQGNGYKGTTVSADDPRCEGQ